MSLNDSRGPIASPQENSTPDPSIWRRLLLDGTNAQDWGPDHTDWRNPTIVDVYVDGRMVVAARYLSNNYGSTFNRTYIAFTIELHFCREGDIIGPRYDLGVALVAPPNIPERPNDASDVAREYRYPDATSYIAQATHFVIFQHLHEVAEPIGGSDDHGGGTSVSFPPIWTHPAP